MEAGVDSLWAVAVMRTGVTSERRPLAAVGRRIPTEWLSQADPTGLQAVRRNPTRRDAFEVVIDECVRDGGGEESEEGQEIIELRDALYQYVGLIDEE
jgi:hypothetical protein